MRSALIDQNGNFVSASNPLPTQLTGRVVNNELIPDNGTPVIIAPGQKYKFAGRKISNEIKMAFAMRVNGGNKKFVVRAEYDTRNYSYYSLGEEVLADSRNSPTFTAYGELSLIKSPAYFYWSIANAESTDLEVVYFGERVFY